MQFTVVGMSGCRYFFYIQNGQFYYLSNNNWIPCGIQGLRYISPQNISIDVGKPILVYFSNPQYSFYTEPVRSIEVNI